MDLKLANIICGLTSAGTSTYPCVFCETAKDDFKKATSQDIRLRTVGSLKRNAENYRRAVLQSRSKTLSAKDYFNCARMPLIRAPDDTLVMGLIVPPGLHLFTGPTNKLYKS